MHQINLQERLKGAIWGQFAAEKLLRNTISYQPSYSDAALLLLRSLTLQHKFSARNFGTGFVETFATPDRLQQANQTTQETIENYHLSLEEGHPDLGYEFQGGANTVTADSATRLASVVALYYNDPKLMFIIDKATRVTQNNELTVAYMRSYTRILTNLFHGEDLHQIILDEINPNVEDTPLDTHVREKVKEALKLESQNVSEATKKLGASSHLDQSYPSAIQAALKHSNSFQEAIQSTMQAGGDSAGRAAIIGSWLGAHLGINAIPEEWRKGIVNHLAIEHAVEALIKTIIDNRLSHES